MAHITPQHYNRSVHTINFTLVWPIGSHETVTIQVPTSSLFLEMMSQAVWLHLPFCRRFSKVFVWLQLTFSFITRPAKPGKLFYAGPIYPPRIISQFIFEKGFRIFFNITYNFSLRQKEVDQRRSQSSLIIPFISLKS